MTSHAVVPVEDWLRARTELLVEEKELQTLKVC